MFVVSNTNEALFLNLSTERKQTDITA